MAQTVRSLKLPNGESYSFYGRSYYGVCNTGAGTASKSVSITGFISTELVTGTKVSVLFSLGNTSTAMTLTVSSTGTKSVYYQGSQAVARFPAGTTIDLIYSGSRWDIVGLREPDWFGSCTTTAVNSIKEVTITGFSSAALYEGTKVTVRFSNAQSYDGVPALNVSSSGIKNIQTSAGVYAGKDAWKAGAIITFVYYSGYWVMDGGGQAISSFNNDAGYLTLSDLPIYDGSVV